MIFDRFYVVEWLSCGEEFVTKSWYFSQVLSNFLYFLQSNVVYGALTCRKKTKWVGMSNVTLLSWRICRVTRKGIRAKVLIYAIWPIFPYAESTGKL